MASFSDLPENVVVEIMSWLPPKSLLQLKYVQKSWRILVSTLVEDPTFVTKHLHNSNNKATSFVFKFLKNKNKRLAQGLLSVQGDTNNNEHLRYESQDFKQLPIHIPFHKLADCFLACCHCNGIICLVDHRASKILLCNPATMEYKLLPDLGLLWYEEEPTVTYRVGFGYDPIAKVYKLVIVSRWIMDFKAHVFTLGHDYKWREINMHVEEDDENYYFGTNKELYCKGIYYWLLKDHFSREETIHSFDMHAEEFHRIQLPYNNSQGDEYLSVWHTNLTQWNGSVALFYYPRAKWGTTRPIEMWLLEASSYNQFWTKHLSIGPLEGNFKIPVAFWTNDEILMKEGDKGLVFYNLFSKKVRSLHFGDQMTWFHAFGYVESLVSINGTKVSPKDPELSQSTGDFSWNDEKELAKFVSRGGKFKFLERC